jgi:predicted nucleic acid-binding protein
MIVVSDTSPLNYLLILGEVDVLPKLFSRVVAPPAVMAELQHVGAPDAVRNWALAPPSWLEIIAPHNFDDLDDLDRGESEAIRLAIELQADFVLIDERRAYQVASRMGIAVAGTIAVIELAANRKLLDVESVVDKLRRTNFRCSSNLLDEMVRRVLGN